MQIYSKSGMSLGKKDKSHMAEFSSNPDERKKREVSYSKHLQKVKAELDEQDALRIKVNKIRHEKGLELFSDREAFEEFVEESGLEDGPLFYFLITYQSGEISDYKPITVQPIFFSNNLPAVTSYFLAEYLCLDHNEIIEANILINHQFEYNERIYTNHAKHRDNFIVDYQRVMFFILFYSDASVIRKLYSLSIDMKNFEDENGSIDSLIYIRDYRVEKLEKLVKEKIISVE